MPDPIDATLRYLSPVRCSHRAWGFSIGRHVEGKIEVPRSPNALDRIPSFGPDSLTPRDDWKGRWSCEGEGPLTTSPETKNELRDVLVLASATLLDGLEMSS